MAVTSLREVTVGVADLHTRRIQFEIGCGLTALASGNLTTATAWRLFDAPSPPRAVILGRQDVPDSPRLRLVEVPNAPPERRSGVDGPGPLGVAFTTRGIQGVHARLARSLRFVSPPLPLNPAAEPQSEGAPPRPQRFEAFGQAADGDFVVLIERVNAATPYGLLTTDCSEPLHVSFVVTNLETCAHFMADVLEHEILITETREGPPFDALMGLSASVRFQSAMCHRQGFPTGRLQFLEFERKRVPMAQIPAFGRGICRLRYDTTDIHETLARVPGGGGSLVRGPAGVDDPVLGRGLVAIVRAPFGVVIELWQAS